MLEDVYGLVEFADHMFFPFNHKSLGLVQVQIISEITIEKCGDGVHMMDVSAVNGCNSYKASEQR